MGHFGFTKKSIFLSFNASSKLVPYNGLKIFMVDSKEVQFLTTLICSFFCFLGISLMIFSIYLLGAYPYIGVLIAGQILGLFIVLIGYAISTTILILWDISTGVRGEGVLLDVGAEEYKGLKG